MSQSATHTGSLSRMRHRFARIAFLTAAVFSRGMMASTPAEAPSQPVLITARQVHELPAAQAAKHLPVHLVGTVSLYDAQAKLFFVQDETGAVFVNSSKNYPIADGDIVEITGTTDSSFRSVVRTDPEVRVLRHGSLPGPVLLGKGSYTQLMGGRWDCRRVTVRGKVRSALINEKEFGHLDMEVLIDGGVINASINHPAAIDADTLIDSEVLVTGLTGASFDAKWQELSPVLLGAAAGDLRVLRTPRRSIADAPQTRVDDVLQTESVIDESRRVRVRGIVTAYRPGSSIVIRQGDRSLTAATHQRMDVPLGSVVDLSGFAAQGDYGPALKQVTIVPAGKMEEVKPYPASYKEAVSGIYSDDLISIRGKVLSQTHTDSLDQLTMMVDGHATTANLEMVSSRSRLADFPAGTEMEVRGICRVTITHGWRGSGITPMTFRVDMRSAEDATILRKASWWTTEHLMAVLSGVVTVSLAISLWAVALRRRITKQTGEIERSTQLREERSRLLEAIGSDTPLPEWLSDLVKTCESLLPGFRCFCDVQDGSSAAARAGELSQGPAQRFEYTLHDGKGAVVGQFVALWSDGHTLSKDERDVLEAFAGLGAIAVNQRRIYQELSYTTTHDQLTGLPNRRMADEHLERALSLGDTAAALVVAHLDVNGFKQVNDQFGERIGDAYLQQIASRIKTVVRSTDLVARIGGDEFLLIAAGLSTVAQAEECRDRLCACFDRPFECEGQTVVGSASVGIAISPLHGTRAEDLKRQADLDMYAAKYKRRAPAPAAPSDLYSASDIERALENDRFVLFYQPLFGPNGNLCGLEALLRMNDPATGIVAPNAFIDVAEGNDVIVPLGAWVVRQAVADAVRWKLPNAGARVMVNVSMRQVEHPGFAVGVLETLRTAGLPSHCLELEITERLLMQNAPQVIRQLKLLREHGIQIAIDDFGVDHSSLSALRSLPFDTLKLDRSFINALEEDERALHIVGAIISIAQKLGKRIVAEGVETEQQIHLLSAFEDLDFQGYYFSRPRPGHEITEALAGWIAGRALPKRKKSTKAPVTPQLAFAS